MALCCLYMCVSDSGFICFSYCVFQCCTHRCLCVCACVCVCVCSKQVLHISPICVWCFSVFMCIYISVLLSGCTWRRSCCVPMFRVLLLLLLLLMTRCLPPLSSMPPHGQPDLPLTSPNQLMSQTFLTNPKK